MSATTQQQAAVVPPRPIRAQDAPKIPPRPARRAIDRSLSPSRDRFAPSPLNETLLSKSPMHALTGSNGHSHLSGDPVERTGSVDLPSVGEEGIEYAAMAEELNASRSQAGSSRAASPEHTRTIGDDLKLHAPKPSLPAVSAKQRVAAVTRTDSEKAASFGIGQPSTDYYAPSSTKKKASATSQDLSSNDEALEEDEHGIPEIGRQVPMYPNAGDVQAPSPAPGTEAAEDVKKHHSRKRSSRGFGDLPPGSYGLHGHGHVPADRLEQAYYSKHPEAAAKEHTPHDFDRVHPFSMSRDELDKIVHETASHGTGLATHDINGTPSEQIGWQAIDETTSRPASVAPKGKSSSFGSQSSASQQTAAAATTAAASTASAAPPQISFSAPQDDGVIHVDEPNNRRKSVMFSEEESPELEYESEAPILALDEVAKDPHAYEHEPAVEPAIERRYSALDSGDEYSSSSRPPSRPASRPASLRNARIAEEKEKETETDTAVVDDDEEGADAHHYEPLFPKEENKKAAKPPSVSSKSLNGDEVPNRFPSRDVWEDAPSSALYTTEVSTPDVVPSSSAGAEQQQQKEQQEQQQEEGKGGEEQPEETDVPRRSTETPAQAFARHQEELAERELRGPDILTENRKPHKPSLWAMQQPHLAQEILGASAAHAAAASALAAKAVVLLRDVWEDAPESLQLEAVVSNPQDEEASSPVDAPPAAAATAAKPPVPQRPARKRTDSSDKSVPGAGAAAATTAPIGQTKPTIPDKPKPHVPARPVRQQQLSADQEPPESVPRAKPAVPARPFGGKIAQLQATFMSDLNKKLRIGPQVPKKEDEPAPESSEKGAADEATKAPLVDARKGRARGPQRRAPRSSPSPAATKTEPLAAAAPALGFSSVATLYSIDPEEGAVVVAASSGSPKPAVDAKAPEPTTGSTKPDAAAATITATATETKEEPTAGDEQSAEAKTDDGEPHTLATNTAGETLVEATLEASPAEETVEPTAVEDNVAKD
ncbi:hypothetical protein SPI_04255 [Niveomyces insectorum RCEF 264]|uniref:Altered inheritance of mitochondria protein 21 n=1 Tax=Niveomyces insectorum RCEF 264 TaxID=1081102 RepID=A0A167VKB1_9HYPO|nr:hypothetical protein SPI_04255 [Niveomyces insectorum RCEF 264]